jgi:formate/nitrite transporter FocA (FNT family)
MPVDERKVREKQLEEIIDRTAPPGAVIYEAVYAEGEHELERNSLELAFSGLTAGSFYLVSTGALGFWNSIGSYVLPAFIGNVIGGIALVAVGVHAEFFEAEEVSE